MSKGGAAGRGRGRGQRPSLWGGRGKRPGGGAAVPDLSAGTLQMIRMSTGHMEGTLQLLYVLLTDCYVYLLRKGACRPLSLSPPAPRGSLNLLAPGDENARSPSSPKA